MTQGTGLSKRRRDLIGEPVESEHLRAGVAALKAKYGRNAALHVVDVERHPAIPADVANYLPRALPRGYSLVKRSLDLIGSAVLIVVLLPLILGIVGFSLAAGGSPLFLHRRVGQSGIAFDCLKFRTMVKDADKVLQDLLDSDLQAKQEWLRDHKLRDDPRITRLGKFLRLTSLDELPQLWNVIRGEMSLVGPRPVVPDEVYRYGTKAKVFLSVRPGITGLWQVSGRNDIDYRRRVAIDVVYVRSQCFFLDLTILAKTLPAVFAKSGAY